MPAARPNLSITLPRNFTFHYTDGQGPRTPEKEQPQEQNPPSPPRPFRLRTRRLPATALNEPQRQFARSTYLQDVPIPTIEAPELLSGPSGAMMSGPISEPVEGLLAPLHPRHHRAKSPPKTPLTQVHTNFDDPPGDRPEWSRGDSYHGEEISRPASACSNFSDSSESSANSLTSFPSTGGSCTSPESDAADPFIFPASMNKGKGKANAMPSHAESSARRRSRHQKSVVWTEDMDSHLWTTYRLYLQDPTVTPFRTASGGAPPLGVCCRVAREAKRSWRGHKASRGSNSEKGRLTVDANGQQVLRDVNDEANAVKDADSPNTIKSTRSGSATPTGPSSTKKPTIKWPGSESTTRKRLRELCHRKYTPSSIQQRFLQSRSPTPFQRSRPRLSSPFGGRRAQPAFATRDINFSLTTSTSATMQPNNPLARLTQGERHHHQRENEEWFGQPVGQRPATTGPLQLGLGINGVEGMSNVRRLGSPFPERPQTGPLQHPYLRPSTSDMGWRNGSGSSCGLGPAFTSPVRLTASLGYSSAHKRRAQHQLEDELSPGGSDVRQNFFEELFGAPAESSHRRVRSRGFSLGDVSQGNRLASLVTPPTIYDQMNRDEFSNASSHPSDGYGVDPYARTQRLGSPFAMPESSTRQQPNNTHGFRHEQPRNALHMRSYTFDDTPSIEERLGQYEPLGGDRKRFRD